MSLENYSDKLKEFFKKNITIVTDENFPPKDKLAQNIELINDYVKDTIDYDETKCILFYISYFTEDNLLRNTIIKQINDKFSEKDIKAIEEPEKHNIIVYKSKEVEEYLKANIKKIRNYYEDFLKEKKKAEEYNEKMKKLEEERKQEEINQKKRMERFILPKISSCEICKITCDSVEIKVPLYEEKDLIAKNLDNITDCDEKYKNEKVEYVIYLFNSKQNKYDKKIFPKLKENYSGHYYIIKLDSLESNTIYLFLAGIKFAGNFSNVTSNKFNFLTAPKSIQGRIFVYGQQGIKNNLTGEDNEPRIILPKGINNYSEIFESDMTKQPILISDNVQSLGVSSKKTCTVIEGGYVIQSGNTYFVNNYDYSEGNFPINQEITIDNEDLEITIESFDPYHVEFPQGVFVKKICVSDRHCLALTTTGECYSWGDNSYGQIGVGAGYNEIIGNPKKINFDVFDSDGHKYITENKPIIYDIAVGEDFSLALGIFKDKKILYHWGNGAGVANELANQKIMEVKSNHPVPLRGIDNIVKIFAKKNTIGILSWDKEKQLNNLYIHGLKKFGIDANFGNYGKQNPIIVNFFRDNGISVLFVDFSNNCLGIIGLNKKNGNKIEVYLRGVLTNEIYGYKEYKNNFMKLENNWAENVISISFSKKCLFFLLKNGVVKKVWNDGKNVKEIEIKIDGYNLNEYITDEIEKVKFQAFGDEKDNFIVFYQKKQ